ncbi:D-glycero-D-manno-heptose 1,7-bisphosphate phosphatase [Arthrobacter sp. V4I6]|uniref:D-glycero-alpha-D-manno-heptose-1,7-bisphosphate 7-phosphatase n=1 Tax=unclassified Arthrobacter TaxID=235627 RepID=UPI0027898B53|nr:MULTISPECIES: HAD-IIIA family hydrolase [unclassified Arthrobacter]MDQ0821231.1 D-glycero-D-manno-heptose 1,7-bisphosphate phosphatase [Arthrobacter sp. V1I7]MDQ0855494.1 D-glycero-D-manno-heptose 1,7-bisphosphate phosphatase [Arthrobacter sp. V4I6]
MGSSGFPSLRAVLFDRDGTLVHDVPYNGDPARVRIMPFARESLQLLRARGIATGVLSNQSGIARGILTVDEVLAVNRRVEELLGPFDVWDFCPHLPEDLCSCRKPSPGMIINACRLLGIAAADAAYIGDIGSDLAAAEAAGARGVLVPTPVTRPAEVDAAPEVATDLAAAVELLLDPSAGPVS